MNFVAWLKTAILWGALSYACGYAFGMFSEIAVPEGAMRGRPLQGSGLAHILGGFAIVAALSWARPAVSWFGAILFELGLLTLTGFRVTIHAASLHPYSTALRLTLPVFIAALLGSGCGAWFGKTRAATATLGALRRVRGSAVMKSFMPLIALVMLAGGAALASLPILGLLGLPLAAAGAFVFGRVAFAFGDPGAYAARGRIGGFILVIGTLVLLLGCLAAVGDIHNHVLSAMRREMEIASRMSNPDPDVRFLVGWRPGVGTLALWLGAPCLLFLGVKLREEVSQSAFFLLLLYWLASAPLAVLALALSYLRGWPLSA